VFELAASADGDFEAQAFFCPAFAGTTTGVGIAMRFGDDLIQVVRGAATAPQSENASAYDYWAVLNVQDQNQGAEEDFTEFFVNGEKKSWGELGDAIGTRGLDVTGTGGISTGSAYLQQMKTEHESHKTMLPVCVGDGQDNLVEVGTPFLTAVAIGRSCTSMLLQSARPILELLVFVPRLSTCSRIMTRSSESMQRRTCSPQSR